MRQTACVGRELLHQDELLEHRGQLVCHAHGRTLVPVALVDGILRLERVVLVVFPASPVPLVRHGGAHFPPFVFAMPGGGRKSVVPGEPPYRRPGAVVNLPVPVSRQNLAVFELKVFPRNVVYAIIFHGVLPGVRCFPQNYYATGCDAFSMSAFGRRPPGRAACARTRFLAFCSSLFRTVLPLLQNRSI